MLASFGGTLEVAATVSLTLVDNMSVETSGIRCFPLAIGYFFSRSAISIVVDVETSAPVRKDPDRLDNWWKRLPGLECFFPNRIILSIISFRKRIQTQGSRIWLIDAILTAMRSARLFGRNNPVLLIMIRIWNYGKGSILVM